MNLVLRKGPDGTDLPPTAINRKLLYERKYDSKGTTILSLETALQWKFNKFIDQHSPKLWPAIPLKFWLLANHSYSWKQHHCRLRETSIQQCTINWKLLKSRGNVFWKRLRKNSFWVHPLLKSNSVRVDARHLLYIDFGHLDIGHLEILSKFDTIPSKTPRKFIRPNTEKVS